MSHTLAGTRGIRGTHCVLATLLWLLALSAQAGDVVKDVSAAPAADDAGGSFLFIPYPITEPTIGNGLVAGPVWMRKGPAQASGPEQPQAFGAGALWTDGGSRGWAAFDHRAWQDGRWWTTAIAGDVRMVLGFDGLAPGGDQDREVALDLTGASVTLSRTLARPSDHLSLRLFAVSARTRFVDAPPPELAGDPTQAHSNGLALGWSRDSRDDLYAPSHGRLFDATVTTYAPVLGASFDAQALALKWAGYRKLGGKGVLGLRVVAEASVGDPPFYLRPYLGFRGLPALRYAGERVASVEAEYRFIMGKRWDLLAFAGAGTARADTRGVQASSTVGAGGLGVRFKAQKYFGLTFGIDVARGPDGTVTYVQIGNAWSR